MPLYLPDCEGNNRNATWSQSPKTSNVGGGSLSISQTGRLSQKTFHLTAEHPEPTLSGPAWSKLGRAERQLQAPCSQPYVPKQSIPQPFSSVVRPGAQCQARGNSHPAPKQRDSDEEAHPTEDGENTGVCHRHEDCGGQEAQGTERRSLEICTL